MIVRRCADTEVNYRLPKLPIVETQHASCWDHLQGDVEYDHLQILEEIASGSFGTVYKAQYKDGTVAVKELLFTENEQIVKLIVREVQALKYAQISNLT